MEPIISPWAIYFIHICPKLSMISAAICVFSMLGVLITFGLSPRDWCYIPNEEEFNRIKDKIQSFRKTLIKLIIIFMVINTIVPDDHTIYAMIVTSLITPDNINLVESNIVDFISKIVDICNSK